MSLNDRSYEEKRDYIRMRVDAEVSLLHAGQVIPAVCLDLSSSGMQVQAPRTFKVGDKLSYQAPNGRQIPVEIISAKPYQG